MTEKTTFEIPGFLMKKLEKHVGKLARRASKLGLEPIAINEISRRGHVIDENTGLMIPLVTIEIDGPMPKLAGWEFAGTIEHGQTQTGENRNLIRALVDSVPVEFRTAEKSCAHCNTKRARKNTYIIRNEESGEFKQVGSTCMKDYLGHKDAAAVASYLSRMLELLDELLNDDYSINSAIRELLARMAGKGGRGAGRIEEIFGLRGFLLLTYRAIRSYGWASRSKGEGTPTADRVIDYIIDTAVKNGKKDQRLAVKLDDEETAVDDAIAWAIGLFQDGDDPYVISDYLYNLNTIAERGEITFKQAGYAASILPAHWRAVEKERAHESKKDASEYQGEIKKRQDWSGLKMTAERSIGGQWGTTYVLTFEDGAGNQFVWFTSSPYDTAGNWLEVGSTYSGKATVKDHKAYRGIKQTIITRAKFDLIEAAAEEKVAA